jgi:hypothetical protein
MRHTTLPQPDLRLSSEDGFRQRRRLRRLRLSLPPTALPPFHAWKP